MESIRVFVSETKVPAGVPAEVAAAFAALQGGLAEVEANFCRRLEYADSRARWEERKVVLGRVDALEKSALSVVASSILCVAESMRKRIDRLEYQAEFKNGRMPLILTHYPRESRLHGSLWFRHGEGSAVEIEIDLRGKDHSDIGVRQFYGRAASFDEAYDRIEAERESIEALIEAMVATALERAEEPAEG